MSDTEQEWKPKGRPQSTMAQAFSMALDNAFMLDSEVDHLSQTVDQKKRMVMIQSRELDALQARIREAEERLKSRRSRVFPSSGTNGESSTQQPSSGVDFSSAGEQKGHPQSPLSSPISDSRPSDEGSTDSGTSAATSNDMDERGEDAGDEDQKQKGKASDS